MIQRPTGLASGRCWPAQDHQPEKVVSRVADRADRKTLLFRPWWATYVRRRTKRDEAGHHYVL